ncbi:L,D-transpeptidase [Actinomycetospora sp. TBRC 11914]|uniref:L,D-transpeptidase n=1 Tax=Actinomycetospora sp. TBRC 11914 TaxID=2729387 RepID=UPI00145C9DCB|nr:L,D-transpeptidase [Actinomycetospora sp. TBRC 11914]NMO93702.1 L,D-transpeptidase [Actinomycetospora sp. TBRC 11914]
MGRHQKHSDRRVTRALLTGSAVGVGVLQAAVPALAAPAAPPPAPAPAAAPAPATGPAKAPCEAAAKACVSISQQKAWLTDGKGNVTRGPVTVTTGGPGNETPQGVFHVMWKDQYHHSREYNQAPMPYSVFFAPGDAFHGGSLQRASAGCVHLGDEDSKAFFNYLQVNDEVQVLP